MRAVPRLIIAFALAACTEQTPAPPAPPPPPAPVAFDQAVLNAGNAVLAQASAAAGQRTVVIDPLVNGVTGEQSASTKALGSRLAALVREHYPLLNVQPFTSATVAEAPLVMVGTFTPVNALNQPAGAREAYRFCLVVADLKTGKTVAKSVARALPAGVDPTPTKAFADSPAWTDDPAIKGYIGTCQATKVGDPIPAIYLNGIITAAMLNQAMEAYDSGRYAEALQLYGSARSTPAGGQLRTYNGLYLTRVKLGDRAGAGAAFGELTDYSLRNNRLALKLLFRPGSTAFVAGPQGSGTYDMWLREIATHGARLGTCLQATGHTSPSGSAVMNERLSVLRAEYVKARLEEDAPDLRGKVVAAGRGGAEPMIGTGADDATDVLDRRVEFKVIPAC